MISYHLTWDLYLTGFSSVDAGRNPWLRFYAMAIAAAFLFVSGISLGLAYRHTIRWDRFLRRLAIISAAALVVTIGSWLMFPGSFIYFGILHCIALSSVLVLPFLRLPVVILVVAAGVAFALPFQINGFFGDGWLQWPALVLGLENIPLRSNDYVPLLPWFGFVLLGLAASRLIKPYQAGTPPRWQATGRLGRLMTWAGRNSLPIYLLHQPILIGLLMGLASLLRP